MGHLAVDTLLKHGVKPTTTVAVLGAGKIGHQVMASLERAGFAPPAVYNRSARDGARPLAEAAAAGHAAYVVCTAAPEAWFAPPAGAAVVVDLGRPGQVAGACQDLDALLAGFGLRLPDEARARAEALVHDAVAHWHTRQRLHASQHVLARVQSLRDSFVQERLEALLAPAIEGLDAPTRKRVLHATKTVVRRYSHEVLGALKETVS
jgi:glutamyl-tRNA reductase